MNLNRGVEKCNQKRDVGKHAATKTQPTIQQVISKYSVHHHRALLVARCATSSRPFNMVTDHSYYLELELLRPGTSPPSARTIARDTRLAYKVLATHVREYFKVSKTVIEYYIRLLTE